MNSAKINLNRYWHKFEQLIADTKIIKKNKKKLRKLKSVNQQLLNNRIHPTKQQQEASASNDEIYGFTSAKFPSQNKQQQPTVAVKSGYKPFSDDSLYQGINFNPAPIPTLMTSSYKLPSDTKNVIVDKTSINYNYYMSAQQQQQQQVHHYNDNAFYLQQLNESLRRKGYKFTLAEIANSVRNEEMYFKGQYLMDEGYLV